MATWKILVRTGACREGRGDANRATHVNHVFKIGGSDMRVTQSHPDVMIVSAIR